MTGIESDVTDVEPKGRLRLTGEAVAGFIRRVPFSIALAVVLVVTAIVTGTAIGTASEATAQTWAGALIARRARTLAATASSDTSAHDRAISGPPP